MSTAVTVTRPIRGSFNSGSVSARTWRTDSFTRRIRSLIRDIQATHALQPEALVVGVDDEAVDEGDVPFLAAEPALGLVEQPLELVVLARDAGDRQPRALPDVVMVDLRDRGADAILELRLRGADGVALLLQRVRLGEVQLTGEDADVAAAHDFIIAVVAAIFELIDAGDVEAVRALVADDPAAAAARDEQGLTAVMRAAYRGGDMLAAVRSADPPLEPFDRIVAGEADGLPAPDDWTPDGFTGLHLAAFAHNPEAARALLESGADPNVVATAGFARVTPLGTCAFANAVDVARVLLEHGADPSIAEDGRATPLAVARANGYDELIELLTTR